MTKTALITGASRGLGAALAMELAATHHIIAVGKTVGALEELDDRIQAAGGQATLAPMDIQKEDAMAQLCRSIYDRWGALDIWAHTAVHAAPLAPANAMGPKDWSKSIDINVNATAALIPMVAPLMKPDGHVVFFDDALVGQKFSAGYGASKAAQIALARAWAAETAKTGPHVHIVTPDPMPTATRARFYPGEDRSPLADPAAQAQRILKEILSQSV
ncbi:SDR family oxidoreductase [Nereida sp. MMG025]|uniref:SDR family NAD(P)-dependent oxidoreductase n=1 Tax=Nereida sp. MMG025 TaxID=2909981 RepID=UPI001F34E1BD|nr:SDR family oxidoreductase [Nereida sp. MMG025]MCF6445332.1 SDR family oxidoreductase [Nereida sp. MMG025]